VIDARLLDPFSHGELLGSPELEGRDPAVRIAVDQVRRTEGTLGFRVLVTWGLPNDYATSFAELDEALVLVVRDGQGGAVAHRLIDPTVNPIEPRDVNFVDRRTPQPSIVFASGRVNVPVEVDCDGEVFVHVALHGIVSNVARVP
jgi:hypothetical protein